MEVKHSEAPERCLVNCQPHTYILLQLLFRFARVLRDKKCSHLIACSLVERCVAVEDQTRGLITSGRLFWLFFPSRCASWFRYVVKDVAMISNGYHGVNDVFAVDFCFDAIDGERDDDDGDGDDEGDHDHRTVRGSRRPSLTSRFAMFDLVRGMGRENMPKRTARSHDSSVADKVVLHRLEDFDRNLELYYAFLFREWGGERRIRLPPHVREDDGPTAWFERLRLLSPSYLFQSNRWLHYRRHLQNLASKVPDIGVEVSDASYESIAKVFEILRYRTDRASQTFVRYARQIFEKEILRDDTVVDLSCLVAWRLDQFMLIPSYFIDRLFPAVEINDTMQALVAEMSGVTSEEMMSDVTARGDSISHLYVQRGAIAVNESKRTQYELKNPSIVYLNSILDSLERNHCTYLERGSSFFAIYDEAHRYGNLEMSSALKHSYRDAVEWFNPRGGFAHRCLNALPSKSTRHCIPFVYAFLDNVPLGYQTLFNFLRLICNVTGVKHTLVELLFILLSGVNQLKPHRSMSLHGILLGPPGTGKSRILNVAKAILGSKYVLMVTYRTSKSNLVTGVGDRYDTSKKLRFMGEFVPPGGHDKAGPLASETSPEATALKEELDTGITRTERVEKVVDGNTGRVSHKNVLVDNICDNANFYAMNEMNFCRSLSSRFVTFEVPLSKIVVVPKGHDAFDEQLSRYKVPEFYGTVRHLVMETARLNELRLFPSRSDDEERYNYRGFVLTWNRLSRVCEELGVKYGLEHDVRIREKCFALGKIISELFAVFTVFGCPPKPVWEAVPKRPGETQGNYNDRLIRGHVEWLGRKSRKYLHDEVVAESALDPADLLFAFSVIFQFIQKERCVLNALVGHLVDPLKVCHSLDEDAFYFVLPGLDSISQTLERKSGLTLKNISDTLRDLESLKKNGHDVFRPIKDASRYVYENQPESVPVKAYALYAPYAADVYAGENESRVLEMARHVQTELLCESKSDSDFVTLSLDERYAEELYFARHLAMKDAHADGKRPPSRSYFAEPPAFQQNTGRYKVTVHCDFYESRLFALQRLLTESLRNGGGAQEDGYVRLSNLSPCHFRRFQALCKRLPNGAVLTQAQREDTPDDSDEPIVYPKDNAHESWGVHLTIFHPSFDDAPSIRRVRSSALDAPFVGGIASTSATANFDHRALVDFQASRKISRWHRASVSPCVKLCFGKRDVLMVNVFLLNQIRPVKSVSSRHSIMRLIMEKTIFRHMTERSSVVYVDKNTEGSESSNGTEENPFGTFSVLEIDTLRSKHGGQLPHFACRNPFKDQKVRNATTDAIDGVRFQESEHANEPDHLTLEKNHVSSRKAYIRAIASGQESNLTRECGKNAEKYAQGLTLLIAENREKYGDFYLPLNCFKSLGRFPKSLVNEGAKYWEHYGAAEGEPDRVEIKQRTLHNLKRLKTPS